MIRFTSLFLLLFSSLYPFEPVALQYDVYYSWLSKIGEVSVEFEPKKDHRYSLTVEGKTVYLGKVLSNSWRETHTTEGLIRGNRLVPIFYTYIDETSSKKIVYKFRFNHRNKRLHRTKEVNEKGAIHTIERYFPTHELSSLMLNLETMLSGIVSEKKLTILGGNKKNGNLIVSIPRSEQLKSAMDLLDTNQSKRIYRMSIDKDSLQGNSGVLYLQLDDNHLPLRGGVEDVFLFGDIVVKRR